MRNVILATLLLLLCSAHVHARQSTQTTQDSKPPRVVVIKSGGDLSSKATKKIVPEYPPEAVEERGVVIVEVVIDEQGSVAKARAVEGSELLRERAIAAAENWKFPVTMLAGNPVRVTGRITVKFKEASAGR